jgi:hypothetical protein
MDTLSDLTAAEKHLWQRVRMEPADGEYPVLVVCPKRRRMRSDDWDGFFFVLFWNALSWFSCGVALMRPPSEWGDLIFMWGVLGVLFLAGLGLIVAWGWHYYAARRAVYVLTNQRALIQTPVFLRRTPRVRKFPVDSSLVRSVRIRKDGSGDIVLRLYESKKADTNCVLGINIPAGKVWNCDMLENKLEELDVEEECVRLNFHTFEVKTLRIAK